MPSIRDALDAAAADLQGSLAAAFAPYAKGFTLEDLLATADNLGIDGSHDTMLWVEVRNGTVVFPRRAGIKCKWFCNSSLFPWKRAFEAGIATGRLTVPDGLPMLWNVFDYSGCRTHTTCTAPLLSVIVHNDHFDVPVPPFEPAYEPYFVPWQDKSDTAFFRGRPWCNPHGLNGTAAARGSAANCSREALTLLSLEQPEALNVSLLTGYGRAPALPGPPTPHADFARYKYLLNLDGITASRRLATLLSINSLVLKQESAWSEWYYAALRPCVHYVPFWQHSERDVLAVLAGLRDGPGSGATAQRIAANAWAFAAAHLSEEAVYRHWQAVINSYVALYRGPADAAAAAAAKAWAEEVGRRASAVGAEAEAQCWKDKGGQCWYVGRDAARAVVRKARSERDAGGGGGGTG